MPQRFRVGPGWSSSWQSRLAILLMQLDQASIDQGSWVLAAELALEAGPPMSVLEQHKLPSVASGQSPYSHILDPRWAEVSLSYLRDQLPSKRKNLGRAYPKKETQTVRLAGAPKPDQRQRGRPSLLHDWAG